MGPADKEERWVPRVYRWTLMVIMGALAALAGPTLAQAKHVPDQDADRVPARLHLHDINGQSDNFPTGAGVMLFGAARWTVRDNSIVGNFLWGAAALSDPTNDTGKAISIDNTFRDNRMGAAFNDTNGVDFFSDGSERGTCFEGNGASATFDTNPTAPDVYPTCPTLAGTGTWRGTPPSS